MISPPMKFTQKNKHVLLLTNSECDQSKSELWDSIVISRDQYKVKVDVDWKRILKEGRKNTPHI